MKRLSINIILLVFFISLVSLAILPLFSELQFAGAKRLEIGYRWSKAEEAYFQALSLNPLNAELFAQAGDFLVRQSMYQKNEEGYLKRAKELYKIASYLNTRYGYYRFLSGGVQLRLGELDGAIENFKIAASLDQNNFRTNYLIGQNLLSVWALLDSREKEFTLTRLKYAIKVNPSSLTDIYQFVLYYTKEFNFLKQITPTNLKSFKRLYYFILNNNLWQYRIDILDKVNYYREKEEPEEFIFEKKLRQENLQRLRSEKVPLKDLITSQDWDGKTEIGADVFKNGNMYWSGTMNTVVEMPKGNIELNIKARGTPADGVFPYMIIELEGELIGETAVDSEDWKQYSFLVTTDGGIKVLSVTFANDEMNEQYSEDRNLFIGDTTIIQHE